MNAILANRILCAIVSTEWILFNFAWFSIVCVCLFGESFPLFGFDYKFNVQKCFYYFIITTKQRQQLHV